MAEVSNVERLALAEPFYDAVDLPVEAQRLCSEADGYLPRDHSQARCAVGSTARCSPVRGELPVPHRGDPARSAAQSSAR